MMMMMMMISLVISKNNEMTNANVEKKEKGREKHQRSGLSLRRSNRLTIFEQYSGR